MNERPLIVVYDACVLVPTYLSSLLMEIAWRGTVRAHWSEDIHQEWMRAAVRDRGASSEAVEKKRNAMDRAVRGACLQSSSYAELIPSLHIPDPEDRHVLAAAITVNANLIVTFNLNDFPDAILSEFYVKAVSPDDLLTELLDKQKAATNKAVASMLARHKQPPKSVPELADKLRNSSMSRTAEALLRDQDEINTLLAQFNAGLLSTSNPE